MNLTIGIVNYKSHELLGDCLLSLAENCSLPYKVIVVNNDAIDSIAERICNQFPSVEIIQNDQNEGFARAVNIAFAKSSEKYFLVLNPDIQVRSGCIETLLNYMEENSGVGLVAPKLVSE